MAEEADQAATSSADQAGTTPEVEADPAAAQDRLGAGVPPPPPLAQFPVSVDGATAVRTGLASKAGSSGHPTPPPPATSRINRPVLPQQQQSPLKPPPCPPGGVRPPQHSPLLRSTTKAATTVPPPPAGFAAKAFSQALGGIRPGWLPPQFPPRPAAANIRQWEPAISLKDLMYGDFVNISPCRMRELREHLADLLQAEGAQPQPVFTAFCEAGVDSEDEKEEAVEETEEEGQAAAEESESSGEEDAAAPSAQDIARVQGGEVTGGGDAATAGDAGDTSGTATADAETETPQPQSAAGAATEAAPMGEGSADPRGEDTAAGESAAELPGLGEGGLWPCAAAERADSEEAEEADEEKDAEELPDAAEAEDAEGQSDAAASCSAEAEDKSLQDKDKQPEAEKTTPPEAEERRQQAEDKMSEAKEKHADAKRPTRPDDEERRQQAEDKLSETKEKQADVERPTRPEAEERRQQAEDKLPEAKEKQPDAERPTRPEAEERRQQGTRSREVDGASVQEERHRGNNGEPPTKRPKRSLLISPAWREGAVAAAQLAMSRKLQQAKEGDKVDLLLSQIHYSQESIRGFFRDGRPVAQMLRELNSGEKAVADIPKISAVYFNGTVYSADNRRLWTFKHCGMPHDSRIPVVVGLPDQKFLKMKLTSPTGGRSVRRRGAQGFE